MPFAVGFTAIGMSPERATLKIFDAILHSLALYFLYLQDDWLLCTELGLQVTAPWTRFPHHCKSHD